jgi:hypothetical protein
MAQYPMLELVKQYRRQKPFLPFVVVLRSGRRFEIVDPDKVAIGKYKVFAYLPPPEIVTEVLAKDIELVYAPRRGRN